jgi:hypothetical protein
MQRTDGDLALFLEFFPEQAEAETRTVTVVGHSLLPDDEYALVEAYCPDPQCDCRRVMLNVAGRQQLKRGFLASVGYGFDRAGEFAGPFLDPLNPQSEYADALLDLVRQVLADPAYVARLESHYRQVKQVAAHALRPCNRPGARLSKRGGAQPARRTSRKRRRT